jgi:hypothetical protein
VFNSQAAAIEAMVYRIINVVSIIVEGGKHELIKVKWWYTKNPFNAVFLNQHNTIIEVANYYADSNELDNMLVETAVEIARGVDALSD